MAAGTSLCDDTAPMPVASSAMVVCAALRMMPFVRSMSRAMAFSLVLSWMRDSVVMSPV